MNKFNHFVGIDISKKTFDAALIIGSDTATVKHQIFQAGCSGVCRHLLHWLAYYSSSRKMRHLFAWSTRVFTAMGIIDFLVAADLECLGRDAAANKKVNGLAAGRR
ncbi:MAG: hypothetical protein WKF59_01710 [Chitinophagaceae bacterium]